MLISYNGSIPEFVGYKEISIFRNTYTEFK